MAHRRIHLYGLGDGGIGLCLLALALSLFACDPSERDEKHESHKEHMHHVSSKDDDHDRAKWDAMTQMVHSSGALTQPIWIDGARTTLSQHLGPANIVSFIYSACPDPQMCPLIVAQVNKALEMRTQAKAFFVTLDPANDTPQAFATNSRRFAVSATDQVHWLSQDVSELRKFVQGFGIRLIQDMPKDPGHMGANENAHIGHLMATFVLNQSGTVMARFGGNKVSYQQLLEIIDDQADQNAQ